MSIGAGKKVLVTGASGFLAAWVVRDFLDNGYTVIGTVRSDQKAEEVRKAQPAHHDRLQFAIVPDIAKADAFDEAVKGVDGVIHTASPFQTSVEDHERDLLIPAIHGTEGILKSIKKNNPGVKRVVVTSSFAAIADPTKGDRPGYVYTEQDWNPSTYEQGKTTEHGGMAYMASKKLAEKAAFDFVKTESPNFSVATICPPMIYGPNSHPVSSMAKLNTSSADIYRLINGSEKDVPDTRFYAFADVRNVAQAHRLAYEKPEAAGQRYFITSGPYSYQEFADIIHQKFPQLKEKTPVGTPGKGIGRPVYEVDNSKAKKLGVQFISLQDCIVDSVQSLLELEQKTGGK